MEDDLLFYLSRFFTAISIHVLRVEDDKYCMEHPAYFVISIHVLRVEDDPVSVYVVNPLTDFNPRPPCGGRQPRRCWGRSGKRFQSTSSVWRTTYPPTDIRAKRGISIHVLRVEDDRVGLSPRLSTAEFQSTSSVWRTTTAHGGGIAPAGISIHVLRVEDDARITEVRAMTKISIHVLRVEDD